MNKIIKSVSVLCFFVLLWFIFSRQANPLFLPKPEAVIDSLIQLIRNGMLGKAIVTSFLRITFATVLAGLVSIPIGLMIANYRLFDEFFTPITSLIRYIPVTVFYPLLIMWLGIGEQMKIIFLFVATFFYFLPSVVLAVKETGQDLTDTAYTMGMTSGQVMLRVLLPYSFPAICETFLMMYGIGWTYVIIVEVVNAKFGLGHIINLATARGRTDLVFVALITIVVISKIFDSAGKYLIKKSFPWKYAREIHSDN